MTATTVPPSSAARLGGSSGPLSGIRPLFRKDVAEWVSGKRAWVVLIVTSLFMALAAANSYISSWIIASFPEEAGGGPKQPLSLVPLDNVMTAAATQIFVLAAIFAAMSLLVGERDRGTLSWVASKPVSRTSIWASKWASATTILFVVAAIIPMALTTAVVVPLYGMPSILAVVIVTLGMGAAIALFVAVTLTASTFVPSQPAVAAIAFAVFLLPSIVLALVPPAVGPFLPTSIVDWFVGLAMGESVGFITPIAWLVSLAALGAISARRMGQLEL